MGLAGLGLKINENKKSDKNTKGMSSLKNFSTQLPPPSTNYLGSPKGSTNLQKHSSVFLEKKKFIEDELKIQTAYNKMRLNEKL